MTASEIASLLNLQPHPEGGWYRETFRDEIGLGGRSRSTAIYYLLEADQRSHWHRVDAVEIWHFYSGAPLALHVAPPSGPPETHALGPDLAASERPQIIVPQGWWQAAESLGAYSLVGCTVAPGFEFSGFELAAPGWIPK